MIERSLLRDILCIIAFVFLGAVAIPAHARPGHGGAASTSSAPVLQNIAVSMGNLTRTSHGAVRLSSADVTTPANKPVTFSGVDLDTGTGTACATWTVTYNSGRVSTDFTLPSAGVAEGASAITPVPSSTGQDHLSGNYVFNVSCADSTGASSNTATLTYNLVTNAVNLGTSDSFSVGGWASTFGNVAGAKILISTGTDWHTVRALLKEFATFTNTVTIEPADAGRYPYFTNFATANINNILVHNFLFSGDLTTMGGTGFNTIMGSNGLLGEHDIHWDNMHGYFSNALIGNSSDGFFRSTGCTSNCLATNISVEDMGQFIAMDDGTTVTVQNSYGRYLYQGGLFSWSSINWEFDDVSLIAPTLNKPIIHTDFFQIADGATIQGPIINRMLVSMADGSDIAQGVIFGGTQFHGTGYIDDGTVGAGSGKVLTLNSPGYFSGSTRPFLYSDSGSPFGIADGITVCHNGLCPTGSQGLTSLASNVNYGSAASPVNVFGLVENNIQISALSGSISTSNAFETPGEAGTSLLSGVTYTGQSPPLPYRTNFTGSVAANVLTAVGPLTNDYPGTFNPGMGPGMFLIYPGCNQCAAGNISSQLTGTGGHSCPDVTCDNTTGTYALTGSPGNTSAVAMKVGDTPNSTGGFYRQNNPTVTGLHTGTFTHQKSYYQGGNGSPTGYPAANTTTSGVIFGTATAADFATGAMPTTTLEAIPYATWHGWTPLQVLIAQCKAQKPKAGGVLDLGSGNWAGAFTGDTVAKWNDGLGTVVGDGSC